MSFPRKHGAMYKQAYDEVLQEKYSGSIQSIIN
jgi:hypothetical protein